MDLADLRRWRMFTPGMVAKTGKIPAVVWTTSGGHDKLGVISRPNGVLFVRRDEQGRLEKLFIPFSFTPTRFGCRVLYGVNSLRCRKCRGLRYQSQHDTPAFRLLNRARKIRLRLGRTARPASFCAQAALHEMAHILAVRATRVAIGTSRLGGLVRADLGNASQDGIEGILAIEFGLARRRHLAA